jgi:hypothetical protein
MPAWSNVMLDDSPLASGIHPSRRVAITLYIFTCSGLFDRPGHPQLQLLAAFIYNAFRRAIASCTLWPATANCVSVLWAPTGCTFGQAS